MLSRVEVFVYLARIPKKDTIYPMVFHPIQSMTNAVKNSSSRSASSFPVLDGVRSFLYGKLMVIYVSRRQSNLAQGALQEFAIVR